jgi:hypothetical protein
MKLQRPVLGLVMLIFRKVSGIETLIDASKEVCVVNTEKTKYMLMSRHQNAGQNHNFKITCGIVVHLLGSDVRDLISFLLLI